jgi:hypothetical protein
MLIVTVAPLSANVLRTHVVMRNVIRVFMSAVAGFFLTWPLGYVYGALNWPTFHSWGLLHGSFFSAWPTLSILAFLALGYVRFLPRAKDTPLLMLGLVWGLVLTGFLGVHGYLSVSTIHGLLAATAAVVAALGIYATHRLRLALLVVAPVVLFIDYVLYDLMLLPQSGFHGTRHALDEVELPLISVLLGWGAGIARQHNPGPAVRGHGNGAALMAPAAAQLDCIQ